MKNVRRSIEPMILVGIVLVLSVIALGFLGNEGLGWFASNDKVVGEGMSVSVKTQTGLDGELNCYPITDITDSSYTVFYDKEVYSLPINDPNSIIYTEYKKALAVIININAGAGGSVRISLSSDSGLDSVASTENKISNCIRISQATLSEDLAVATKTDATYRFVSITDGVATKTQQIDLGSFTLTEGENKICFLIEYDEELLEYVSQLILSVDPNAFRVVYSNDIVFSVID